MKIIFAVALILAFASCEKRVEFRVDALDDLPVLNATISPDSGIHATLTRSIDPLSVENADSAIGDAVISLYRNGLFAADLDDAGNGKYMLDSAATAASPGDRFSLRVRVPEKNDLSAETTIPPVVNLHDLHIIDTTFVEVHYFVIDTAGNYVTADTVIPHYKLQLSFDDPRGEDYYALSITYRDASSASPVCYASDDAIFSTNNQFVPGSDDDSLVTLCETYYFNDITFDGTQKTITFYVVEIPTDFVSDPRLLVRLDHLSADYYRYITTSALQNLNFDNPFAEPVTIYSNVQNGFGIFAGYSTSSTELAL